MRFIYLVLLVSFSMPGFAKSIDAPGKIFYKMPQGEIATRDAVLEVPARGQGDVILKGSQSEIVAERFFSKSRNGRTIFYVVFDQFPGQQGDERAVYRGTYTRGSNLALYYGDVFVVDEQNPSEDDLHFWLSDLDQLDQDVRYVAGFFFKAVSRD